MGELNSKRTEMEERPGNADDREEVLRAIEIRRNFLKRKLYELDVAERVYIRAKLTMRKDSSLLEL